MTIAPGVDILQIGTFFALTLSSQIFNIFGGTSAPSPVSQGIIEQKIIVKLILGISCGHVNDVYYKNPESKNFLKHPVHFLPQNLKKVPFPPRPQVA